MRKKILIVSILLLTFACKENNVEEDMNAYCDCVSKNLNLVENEISCDSLMQEIVERYEYEPEALPIILEKAKRCQQ